MYICFLSLSELFCTSSDIQLIVCLSPEPLTKYIKIIYSFWRMVCACGLWIHAFACLFAGRSSRLVVRGKMSCSDNIVACFASFTRSMLHSCARSAWPWVRKHGVVFPLSLPYERIKLFILYIIIITTRRRKSACLLAINITLICGILSIVVLTFVRSLRAASPGEVGWSTKLGCQTIVRHHRWRFVIGVRLIKSKSNSSRQHFTNVPPSDSTSRSKLTQTPYFK